MSSGSRLSLALAGGALHLAPAGRIAVFRAGAEADLGALPRERVTVVQGNKASHDAWARRGYAVATAAPDDFAQGIVVLPRGKDEARALIAAASATGGPVIVDGQKTDGVDSVLREVRARVAVSEPFAKAHGKVFQFQAAPATFADWALAAAVRLPSGWVSAPGLFSADGPDPGSIALAAALPARLAGRVADLGAGWGYLSFHVLERPGVRECALVEIEHAALEAARMNISDPRARFHWADATVWSDPAPFDHVVTNPPFHTGRTADPTLGAAFIAAAARLLGPHGTLWLVANRHLPYEAALAGAFRDVRELEGTPGYKIFAAERPQGARAEHRRA